ncbi:MAG TPA: high-potential iron-sulfur protein [Steroidobacteraceae bacterium]|nr:high-potential iron-sulfur protein [Steroidobacteraceae bacterium]
MCPAHLSRRAVVAALALGSLGALDPGAPAPRAAAPVRVDPNDPAARALGYVENAQQVDARKYPGFIPGSNCDNCLQLEGKPGNEYRPCKTFQGKLVAVGGWCSAWTAEI